MSWYVVVAYGEDVAKVRTTAFPTLEEAWGELDKMTLEPWMTSASVHELSGDAIPRPAPPEPREYTLLSDDGLKIPAAAVMTRTQALRFIEKAPQEGWVLARLVRE